MPQIVPSKLHNLFHSSDQAPSLKASEFFVCFGVFVSEIPIRRLEGDGKYRGGE